MVEELQLPIEIEGEGEITLHQVLMSLRSKVCYDCTIFQAINKHASTGDIMVLCHSGYEKEVNKIVANLVTLCNEQFGLKTTKWFTQEAVEEVTIQVYDRVTNTIEVDKTRLNAEMELFASFRDHTIQVARRRAQITGETLPVYDGGFKSDTSSDDKDEPK